ncbi:hypothetical protein M5689_025045 [Euphorbia peplus]|nr:hypothetical protein M5689_025045 [Euphorbia peplus]
MNNAIIRSLTSTTFLSSPSKIHQTSNFNWNSSVVTFKKFTSVSSKPDNKHNMDKAQNPDQNDNKSNENVMSHSFGEGYATRSDEEGFGGIYGGNQQLPKVDIDKKIHQSHPAYDKSQGSEVKEKEKGRHQTNSDS